MQRQRPWIKGLPLAMLCTILSGTATLAVAGTITSLPPDPNYFYQPAVRINQPGSAATGANLAGAIVTYSYETSVDAYTLGSAVWSQSGNSAGGVSVPNRVAVSLSGNSRSEPIQITNTGSTHLDYVDIDMSNYTDALLTSAVFDVSSRLAYGSTTEGTIGTIRYVGPSYLAAQYPLSRPFPNTPYYATIYIQFSGAGLSPGASATLYADLDSVAPEPGTATLMGAAAIFLMLYMRYKMCSPARG